MPAVSRNVAFSDPTYEVEDYVGRIPGYSRTQRWYVPLHAKAGDVYRTRRGKAVFFGYAASAIAAPATTAAVLTAAVTNGVITSISAVPTAGAGYAVGEILRVQALSSGVPVGIPAIIQVATVNSTGGILTATVLKGGTRFAAGAVTAPPAAFPFTLCGIANAQLGTIGSGTTHKAYAAIPAPVTDGAGNVLNSHAYIDEV